MNKWINERNVKWQNNLHEKDTIIENQTDGTANNEEVTVEYRSGNWKRTNIN